MRVISKRRLREYWETTEGRAAKTALQAWYKVAEKADWKNFAQVKQTYGANADMVGDCIVFDICGNHYRLITKVRFESHKVFVRKVMTHNEYDRGQWKVDCGCIQTPSPKATRAAARKRPRGGESRRGK